MAAKDKSTEDSKNSKDKATPGSPEAVAALTDSPCLNRGTEMIMDVIARTGDEVTLRFQLCGSPALFVVHFQKSSIMAPLVQPIVDQRIEGSQPVFVPLGRLEEGSYTLTWQFSPAADSWQSVAEVTVESEVGSEKIVRFRRYQSTESRIPLNLGFARIEVRL